MATPTSLPATFTSGQVLTAAQMNNLRGAFRILQVVRATDTTERATTSTSVIDVPGMSVTITPTSADSDIIIMATGYVTTVADSFPFIRVIMTDSSNVAISGGEQIKWGAGTVASQNGLVMVGYDSPATTSATTYKLRFRSEGGQTVRFRNNLNTGQMFAFEVSA